MDSIKRPKLHQLPVNWMQRVALYTTNSHHYLIGSNNIQTAFKILKIDRTEPVDELRIVDDGVEYNYQETLDLIRRLESGNRNKLNSSGITKECSSFGLLGFVRFLHGYYLILIVRRRKVASIGFHTVFKVEETKLVYIPRKQPSRMHDEELRFLRSFCKIDLSSNFYFSYSYDLSHSLQYNLSPVRPARFMKGQDTPVEHLFVKSKLHHRFIWNSHLIDFPDIHDDWKIHIIHGFIAQAEICIYSKPIYITLIARRSRYYSGTRFLKRGLNLDGDVANEVETEQIVHDASVSDFTDGHFTSFVQMRGSLPDRWSQDATKIVPKPTITQDFVDPYHVATAKHLNNLIERYGTPIVVFNLIKQNEKKSHESVLQSMLSASVNYLNQFLPRQHIIKLIAFDMAQCSKSANENVMKKLEKIGFNIIRVVGIFQSWTSANKAKRSRARENTYTMHLRQRTFNRQPSSFKLGGYRLQSGQCLQNGVVRVNCVDSLDRTNTAQFALGKTALGFQLKALGILIEPSLEYDTDAVRLLEQLYEDHGDTIALQYGGSQLVHRVQTYRKLAPITSHSREILQTLSRYYSNAFSDTEKQNVINLFLGIRKARPGDSWNPKDVYDLMNDYYLHSPALLRPFSLCGIDRPYTQWWNQNTLKSLPRSHHEYEKESNSYLLNVKKGSTTLEERIDHFYDANRPFEFTCLMTAFPSQILSTIRDFMPYGSTNSSPFCIRLAPGKLQENYLKLSSQKNLPPNPSVYGLPTSSSDGTSILDRDSLSANTDLDDEARDLALYTSYYRIGMSSNQSKVSEKLRVSHEVQEYINFPMSKECVNPKTYPSIFFIPDRCKIEDEDMTMYSKYTQFIQNC